MEGREARFFRLAWLYAVRLPHPSIPNKIQRGISVKGSFVSVPPYPTRGQQMRERPPFPLKEGGRLDSSYTPLVGIEASDHLTSSPLCPPSGESTFPLGGTDVPPRGESFPASLLRREISGRLSPLFQREGGTPEGR